MKAFITNEIIKRDVSKQPKVDLQDLRVTTKVFSKTLAQGEHIGGRERKKTGS